MILENELAEKFPNLDYLISQRVDEDFEYYTNDTGWGVIYKFKWVETEEGVDFWEKIQDALEENDYEYLLIVEGELPPPPAKEKKEEDS